MRQCTPEHRRKSCDKRQRNRSLNQKMMGVSDGNGIRMMNFTKKGEEERTNRQRRGRNQLQKSGWEPSVPTG